MYILSMHILAVFLPCWR